MKLDVTIGEQTIAINVPDTLLQEAQAFFEKMDNDMNQGWQISRRWVDKPNTEQRCKIAADRILGAIELDNRKLATLMAGYILSRAPEISAIDISTNGEIEETQLISHQNGATTY